MIDMELTEELTYYQSILIKNKKSPFKLSHIYGIIEHPQTKIRHSIAHKFLLDTGASISVLNRSFNTYIKDNNFEKIDTVHIQYGGNKAILPVYNANLIIKGETKFFQLIFAVDGIQYRYGFEATDNVIVSEWLFGTPNKREVCFFTRENDKIVDINEKHYNEGKKRLSLFDETEENEIVRDNSLFLSAIAAMNGKLSKQLVKEISSITVLSGLSDNQLFHVAGSALKNTAAKQDKITFLKLADTGINSLDLIDYPL